MDYTGRMPAIEADPRARTTLCRECATLIRYWPARDLSELDREVDPELDRRGDPGGVWRHAIAAAWDHEPLPMPEGEARAMYGDR